MLVASRKYLEVFYYARMKHQHNKKSPHEVDLSILEANPLIVRLLAQVGTFQYLEVAVVS